MLPRRLLSLGCVLFLAAVAVKAQTTITWSGLGANGNFSNAGNWTGNSPPTASDVVEFGATTNPPTVDAVSPVDGIIIDSTAGSLGISGSQTLQIGSSGIDNRNVSNTETISAPIEIMSSTSAITNAGTLSIGGNVTLSSSTLTLGGSGAGGGVSGIISGGGGLVKQGNGTWTLSGANSYTGSTSITSGTLVISSDSNLGQAPAAFTPGALTIDGGTLEVTGTGATLSANRGITVGNSGGSSNGSIAVDARNTVAYGGTLDVAATNQFNKDGAGTLTLTGTNSYAGITNVRLGTLQDSNTATSFSPNSDISVVSGANLAVNSNETIGGLNGDAGAGGAVTIAGSATLTLTRGGEFPGTISGSGGLSLSAATPFGETLTGANDYTGSTTIGGNTTLQLGLGATGVGGATGSIASANVANDGTLLFYHSDDITFAGNISGAGQVHQEGGGTLTLTGSNTYDGGTFISSGTVMGTVSPQSGVFMSGGNFSVASSQSIQALGDWTFGTPVPGNVILGNGANLTLTSGSKFSGVTSGVGSLEVASGAYETLEGNATHSGGTTIDSGATLQIGSDGSSGSVSGSIVDNGSLVFRRSDGITHAGVISGTGNVVQQGGGTLTLTGVNTYSGSTSVENGTLAVSSDGNLGQAPSAATGGSLILNGGTLEAVSSFGLSGNRGINLGVNGGSIQTDPGTILNYNGNIAGSGYLTKTGAGTLVLGGTSSYAGGTVLSAGTLSDAQANALAPTGTIQIASGALLDVTQNENIGGLEDHSSVGGGNVTITAGKTLTLSGGSGTFSGDINGAGATVALDTSQTLAGNVSVDVDIGPGGYLSIGNGGATGSITGAITNIGGMEFNRSGSASAGGIAGTGSLTVYGGLALTLTGTNAYTGGTTISSGSLSDANANAFPVRGEIWLSSGTVMNVNNAETIGDLGADSGVGAPTVNLVNGATLTINGASYSYPYGGTITGTGGSILILGNQSFSGSNTYTGGTTISSGTLTINTPFGAGGSGTGTGSVSIAGGARLQLGYYGAGGAVTGNIIDNGNISFLSTDANGTYGGVISGSGGLTVGAFDSSIGSLTLTGANIYTGPTDLESGMLVVGAANTLPTNGFLQFQGGTLDLAYDQQIGGFFGSTTSHYSTITVANESTLTVAPQSGMDGGTFDGTISGGGVVKVAAAAGSGVTLSGDSTFSGGTTVSSGILRLGGSGTTGSGATLTSGPVGTGTLTVKSGAELQVDGSQGTNVTVANPVSVENGAILGGGGGKDSRLVLSGPVTVPGSTASVKLNDLIEFGGTLAASSPSTSLTFNSGSSGSFGTAVLSGTIDPSISTMTVDHAGVIFGSATAVPSSGLTVQASSGYVGVGQENGGTAPSAGSVINLLQKSSFAGTIGFDTDSGISTPHTFSDAIDLGGFGSGSSVTIGSESIAVLTGVITPQPGEGYVFGNGGGVLAVQSALDGGNNLTVASDTSIQQNSLLTIFQGGNTFTGNMSVTNGTAILDSTGALPSTAAVTLGDRGYIGFTEAYGDTSDFATLAQRLTAGGYTSNSVIGIDSHAYISTGFSTGNPSAERDVFDTIDLTAFGPIYLGTATAVKLNGLVLAPNQNGANRTLSLVARRDGALVIYSPLLSGNVSKVVVGLTGTSNKSGTVALLGANTYAGGTILNSGTLVAGGGQTDNYQQQWNSLGTGALEIPSGAQNPILAAGSGSTRIFNPVQLDSSLQVGVPYGSGGSLSATSIGSLLSSLGYNTLNLEGVISGPGGLNVYGYAQIDGANTFTGGVNLFNGSLVLGDDSALGVGTLTFSSSGNAGDPYFSISSAGGLPRTIANPIVFEGGASMYASFNGNFTLNGGVSLAGSATLAPSDGVLTINGPIGGTGGLTVSGYGTVLLNGANTYTGRTEVDSGNSVVFGSASSIPGASQANRIQDNGYVGVSFVPGNVQSDFINHIDPGSVGSVGFDSPSGTTNVFSGAIDMSGIPDLEIGSASSAKLTGTITPYLGEGGVFRFGNGGGQLEVASNLTDGSRAQNFLMADSDPTTPLTLHLTGTNSYSGGTSISYSGVVFGPGALPASGSISVFSSGYAGTEDPAFAADPAGFIGRFDASSGNVVVGFDSLTVSGNISLAGFVSTVDPKIFIGTATTATISSPAITLPGNQTAYRFAGFKGGQLTVTTTLGDDVATSHSVQIGDESTPAMFGSPIDATSPDSSVVLSGANTYTGGTNVYAGDLKLGSSSVVSGNAIVSGPVGTGAVNLGTSSSTGNGRKVGLLAYGATRTLANAITVASGADFGGDNDLVLSGAISGSGMLDKIGVGKLSLSGDNSSFSGEVNIESGTVEFDTANSVGTGGLGFGNAAGTASFLASSAVNGVSGFNKSDEIDIAPGATLTIHQTSEGYYSGILVGSSNSGLTIDGLGSSTSPATFYLAGDSLSGRSGTSYYNGSVTVGSGVAVIAGNNGAFGAASDPVNINGGELDVDSGITISNPISLVTGAIGGRGTFVIPSGSSGFNIGANMVLDPGYNQAGTLTIDGGLISTTALTLSSGGTYNWNLMDATTSGGWDLVSVKGAVDVTSITTNPFTINLVSVGGNGSAGFASDFDPTQNYQWVILTATNRINLTSLDQFQIDRGSFENATTGVFSLTLDGTGDNLMLDFSPVPEPSTYVLMIAGLGITGLAFRRRRRRGPV